MRQEVKRLAAAGSWTQERTHAEWGFLTLNAQSILPDARNKCYEYIHDVSYSIYLDIPAYSWMKALWNNGVISNSVLDVHHEAEAAVCKRVMDTILLLSVVHTEKMHLLVICDPCTDLIPGHYYIEYKLEGIYKSTNLSRIKCTAKKGKDQTYTHVPWQDFCSTSMVAMGVVIYVWLLFETNLTSHYVCI